MQTHTLSSAALHGIGRVLSANTPYLEGRTPQPRTFEVGPETPCFRAVGIVGALEGNGDSPQDPTTKLILFLARRFDVDVRFYFQYMDIDRAEKLSRFSQTA